MFADLSKEKCESCGSSNVQVHAGQKPIVVICNDCGHLVEKHKSVDDRQRPWPYYPAHSRYRRGQSR